MNTFLLALAAIAIASYVAHLIAVIKADSGDVASTRPPASHHPDLFDPGSRWTRPA